MESKLDLNLLLALDALLEQGSVSGAAERLHTSAPAMSRTLARLRRVVGDPLLVRAGRAMAPTPRALEMRSRVRTLVEQAAELFTPPAAPEPAKLERTFSVQIGDMVFSTIGSRLMNTIRCMAPGVTLRFMAESHEDTPALREGILDLEVGQIHQTQPEIRVEPLIIERMVGVVRAGHPLAASRVTARTFAAADHISVSRRGRLHGPIDEALAGQGLRRRVAACTPTLAGALFLVRDSDLVGIVPERLGLPAVRVMGLHMFEIPLELPAIPLSMAWHPRFEGDGAHAWLRHRVREVVQLSDTVTS